MDDLFYYDGGIYTKAQGACGSAYYCSGGYVYGELMCTPAMQ